MASPKLSHINNFDLLRLFAACQVVVIHSTEHLGLTRGWLQAVLYSFPGVPIFYVISGFLICASFEKSSAVSYWRNRGFRLFPGLWACTFVTIAMMVGFGALTAREAATPGFLVWLAGQLTVAQFLPASMLRDFGMGVPNGSLPTISFELQFYAVLPFLYWIGSRTALKGRTFDVLLAVAALISFASNVVKFGLDGRSAGFRFEDTAPAWQKLFMVTFVPYIWLFLIGALIYRNWERLRPMLEGKGIFWLVGYVLVALGFEATGNHLLSSASGLILAFAVIALAYTAPTLSGKILGKTDISYGIYLYHMPVINCLIEMNRKGNSAVWLLVPAVLTFAVLSRFLVELPAMKLKGRERVVTPGPDPHPA
jgi:peptidoglycan/LPS O-acetylase OafA/YrhL